MACLNQKTNKIQKFENHINRILFRSTRSSIRDAYYIRKLNYSKYCKGSVLRKLLFEIM